MFDRLIDVIIEFIGLARVWFYVDPFEEALIIRAGKFHRKRGPGWWLIIPLGIEKSIVENVKPEPVYLDVQSLHTNDQYAMNICVGGEYEIIDLKKHTLDFENTQVTNCLVAASVITEMVQINKFNTVNGELVRSRLRRINAKIKKRGARFTGIWLQDASNGAAARYWHEGIELDLGGD